MTDTAVSSPVTAAYVDALAGATGRPVGDGQKPKGQANLYPYGIVYVGTVRLDGNLLDPKEDGLHRVQVTCVGVTRASAEHLRDLARNVLHDRDVLIDGYAVTWTEHAGSPPIFRDDDATPPVFSAVEVANVFVTPLAGS